MMWDDIPTPSLAEYVRAEREDPRIFWRIGCGHHENLLDAALDRIEELEAELQSVEFERLEEAERMDLE